MTELAMKAAAFSARKAELGRQAEAKRRELCSLEKRLQTESVRALGVVAAWAIIKAFSGNGTLYSSELSQIN